ncbi:MAG: flagellar basal body-associated FliL family protein [Nakamurella sp.]
MATITDSKRSGPKGGNAKDAKESKDSTDGTDGKKGMSKVVLIVIVAVVMAAVGGVGYFMFLKKPGPPPAPKAGVMVKMDAQTLTLADGHFLKIEVAIQLVEGDAGAATFETVQAAQILIDTFSNLPVSALTTNAARKSLTAQLLKGLQKAYPKEVYAVFLTQFVIQ